MIDRVSDVAAKLREFHKCGTTITVPRTHVCPPDGWRGSNWSPNDGHRWVVFAHRGTKIMAVHAFEPDGSETALGAR